MYINWMRLGVVLAFILVGLGALFLAHKIAMANMDEFISLESSDFKLSTFGFCMIYFFMFILGCGFIILGICLTVLVGVVLSDICNWIFVPDPSTTEPPSSSEENTQPTQLEEKIDEILEIPPKEDIKKLEESIPRECLLDLE